MEYFLYCAIFMIINIAAIWTMSVERYFNTNSISTFNGVYEMLFVFTIIDIILNIYYNHKLVDSYRFGLWR